MRDFYSNTFRIPISLENKFEPLPDTDSDKKPVSKSWARLIKKVYEVDPLKCPKCSGAMKIKAFIRDPKEISRICENLGLADWQAPPVMGKDKKYQEPEYDEYYNYGIFEWRQSAIV